MYALNVMASPSLMSGQSLAWRVLIVGLKNDFLVNYACSSSHWFFTNVSALQIT